MTAPVRLIPLVCQRCAQPLPAGLDEVAWCCAHCQQGQMLTQDGELTPVEIHFDASLRMGERGRPFWVAEGQVTNLVRTRFKGDQSQEMLRFWAAPRRFYVPAYETTLDEGVAVGLEWIEAQPPLTPGAQADFQPVTVLPDDVQALAEFIVLAVEANRKDKLSRLDFDLQLGAAELWIIP
ncbi:MAG TPA: hypothetical protein VLH85_07090 [Levilinea sp.]|nr:hypothetical protein [Levilinea sp.]